MNMNISYNGECLDRLKMAVAVTTPPITTTTESILCR